MNGPGGVWAVVPVKTLTLAKSRLAAVLDENERVDLSRRMLLCVLMAVAESKLIDNWLIVSRDQSALDLARRRQGLALVEEKEGLNASLEQAAWWLQGKGATAMLVLPGDLPFITGEEIDNLLGQAIGERGVVIVPSRRGDGTNGLFLRPPNAMPFCFGPGSADRHAAEARRLGLSVWQHWSEGWGFDVDTEEDLRELSKRAEWASLELELVRKAK